MAKTPLHRRCNKLLTIWVNHGKIEKNNDKLGPMEVAAVAKNRFITQIVSWIGACTIVLMLVFALKHDPEHIQATYQQQSSLSDVQKPLTLLFDLHGVLFKISKKRTFSRLGFSGIVNMLGYRISGHTTDELEEIIFEMLHRLHGDTTLTYTPANKDVIPMHKDKMLPKIMCDWLLGKVSGVDIMKQLGPLITTLENEGFFASKTEVKIIKKIASIMFDPVMRSNIYIPLKKGVRLLKQCKAAGHKIYLLSNMDTALIKLLEEKYPDIFKLFDGLIVSGDVKLIKPDPAIYTYALKKYGIDPATCYVLDDQHENIVGARRTGVHAMLFTEQTAKQVRQELTDKGVFAQRSVMAVG